MNEMVTKKIHASALWGEVDGSPNPVSEEVPLHVVMHHFAPGVMFVFYACDEEVSREYTFSAARGFASVYALGYMRARKHISLRARSTTPHPPSYSDGRALNISDHY